VVIEGKKAVHVLVVDDNPDDAELLGMALSEIGRRVVVETAEDASTMTSLLASSAIFQSPEEATVIVMDWNLPDGDGIGLLSRLKSDPSLAHVPVVLCSGADHPELHDAAHEAGATACVVKPSGFDGFLALAEQLTSIAQART
jgi:two-component system chemotaxis response regulator CheY